MTTPFLFFIRPLSQGKGYVLECDGIIRDPLRSERLVESVIHAVRISEGVDAEIRILDIEGRTVETLKQSTPL